MTTTTATRTAGPYTGNGSTVAFAFNFKTFAAADIQVIQTLISTGAETVLTLTTDYSVSLNADQDANPGGTVTLVTAHSSSYTLTITTDIAETQSTNLTQGGGYYPGVIEDALDRNAILAQQLRRDVDKAIRLPLTSSASGNLPAPVADAFIGWNAAGTALRNLTSDDLASLTTLGTSYIYNVQADFGALGDGSSDDTTEVAAAVAAAYAAGARLYWPAGTYVTTASIPNLHDVRHEGAGAIKRGSDTFYVAPRSSQANTLYVAASGTTGSDGLSSSQPMDIGTDTWDFLSDALANYGPVLDGTWRIKLAAGTYPGGYVHPRYLHGRNFVYFEGPTQGHPNVPTAIIDKATSASETVGMSFFDGILVDLKDIKFTGAFAECVSLSRNVYCWFRNVHCGADGSSNYPVIGWTIENHCRYFVAGGIIDGCTGIGVSELFGVVRSFNTVASATDQLLISNCAIAFKAKEFCSGHLQYLRIDTADTGIELDSWCTANMGNADIKSCGIGIVLNDSEIHDEENIVWGSGADANTIKLLPRGFSSLLTFSGWVANTGDPANRTGNRPPVVIEADYDADTHTGTTSITAIWTELDALPAGYFSVKGARFEVEVIGRIPVSVTLAGDVTIYLYIEGQQEASLTIPSGAATQGWTARFTMICPSDGNTQIYSGTLIGETFNDAYTIRRTRDLASQDNAVAIRVALANADDSITLDSKVLRA